MSVRPLAGLKVFDLAWVVAGPVIGRALADFGATVVRVESSRRVETSRLMGPFPQGKSDAQQSVLIKRMVRDLAFNTEIVVLPIVREASGLAMSSRNNYLDDAQRRAATVLNQALSKASEAYDEGEHNAARLTELVRATIEKEPLARIDYVNVNDAETLAQLDKIDERPVLVSLAVFIGNSRLIDNVVLGKTKKHDAAGA